MVYSDGNSTENVETGFGSGHDDAGNLGMEMEFLDVLLTLMDKEELGRDIDRGPIGRLNGLGIRLQ